MAWEELMDESMQAYAAAGYDDLRLVHRSIIRDLLLDGLRPTELAARLGLSKQAVNDLLREFEANGYIRLEPDPSDGRAKRVVVTDRGWAMATLAADVSRDVGRRWAARVGEDRFAVFEEVLREITGAGEAQEADAEPGGQSTKR